MKKSNILTFIFGGLFYCVITTILLFIFSIPKKEEIKFNKAPDGFAIMLFDEGLQDYVESEGIPIGLYQLNSDKSYCVNGGVIDSYERRKGKINYSVDGTDECVVYLDVIDDNQAPEVTEIKTVVKNITAVISDDSGITGYMLTTTNEEPTSWNEIETMTYNYSETVSDYGIYYLWTKDIYDNVNYTTINVKLVYYYAYGTPTLESTTDYTTLGVKIFTRDDDPSTLDKELCLIKSSELYCF